MMNAIKEKTAEWFFDGEVGESSRTMACHFAGLKLDKWRISHPYDPGDFNRCRKYLLAVPEARQRLGELAALSPEWAALVARWDEIEQLFNEELRASGAALYWQAPKTYTLMRAILDAVEVAG